MNIFNRRNALVGYVALKALKARRRRGKRGGIKLATYVTLGLVSVGILAALAAILVKRQRESVAEPQRLEGYAVAEESPVSSAPADADGEAPVSYAP